MYTIKNPKFTVHTYNAMMLLENQLLDLRCELIILLKTKRYILSEIYEKSRYISC